MPYTKICVNCGKEFVTPYKDRKFCSWSCYNERRGVKSPQKCLNCGKEFQPSRNRGMKFCSWECYNKYRSPTVFVCLQCGKEFTAPGRKEQKFCSRKCTDKWYAKHHPERMNKMQKARWAYRKYLDEGWVRKVFEEFRRSRLSLRVFATMKHYGERQLSKAFKRFMPVEYEAGIEDRLSHAKSYRKGRQFEYRVRDFLGDKGYFVLRSPRSRGPVDLVAIRKGAVLFLQCKSWGNIGKEEKERLVDLAESVSAVPILVRRTLKPPKYPLCFVNLKERKEISVE